MTRLRQRYLGSVAGGNTRFQFRSGSPSAEPMLSNGEHKLIFYRVWLNNVVLVQALKMRMMLLLLSESTYNHLYNALTLLKLFLHPADYYY